MKKIIIAIAAVMGLGSVTSCSDMLETESSRQMFEPELNAKTDSLFYYYGIAQAMQQLADQYVFQGEMRGDLTATTEYTDNNLRELANFSATTANKYDSAYVYYRVINNCNYYIAHRDTSLKTGATAVVMNEYAAVKSIRAWAYLQLAKNYGKVPYFTEPLTKISQIENGNFPVIGLQEIAAKLIEDLAPYTGYQVPATELSNNVGRTNWGGTKTVYQRYLFVPVDVMLGELYLETGNFAQACHHYTLYLTELLQTERRTGKFYSFPVSRNMSVDEEMALPSDITYIGSGSEWSSIFSSARGNYDFVSYIPMAVNRLMGTTTELPSAFGFDYYAVSRDETKLDETQIHPSAAYYALSDSCDYYYLSSFDDDRRTVKSYRLGDARLDNIAERGQAEDSTKIWIQKYNNGNIILYRTSTIWLRLAEAFNRMGHYDIAFAILKDGMSKNLLDFAGYVSPESKSLLQTTYPLLSEANIERLPILTQGIHSTGSGFCHDHNGNGYFPGLSPYQLDTVVGMKMAKIAAEYGVAVGTTKEDSINAMEDLISDEYALEAAFEGDRFGNLTRIARHKNRAGLYDANFGGKWFAKKLEANKPVKDLTIEQNWYLPFK